MSVDVSVDSITFTYLAMGIMRAGCAFFPISPRNSSQAVAHLLVKTNCHHVFVSPDRANQTLIATAVASLEASFKVSIHATPTFEYLCADEDDSAPFVAPKRSADDITAIYHSSGEMSFMQHATTTYLLARVNRISEADLLHE